MPGDHLPNNEFFKQLESLFSTNGQKQHGSVFLTQKRLSYESGIEVFTRKKGQTDTLADLNTDAPLPVIVRATNGDSRTKIQNKIKISTIVNPDDLEGFYSRYAEICRTGMSSLKKRDRRTQKMKARKKKVAESTRQA